MIKNFTRIWLVALLIAWFFDFLFWKKQAGISFPIFWTLCLVGGLFLAWSEKVRPAWQSLLLVLPLQFFTWMVAFRSEPFTTLVNAGFSVGLLALLAASFLDGRWIVYNLWDYVVRLIHLGATSLGLPALMARKNRKDSSVETKPSRWKQVTPFIRGLLFALPILALFASLLASADPIFKKGLEDLLAIFNLEHLAEYIFRLFYILILAYVLTGVFIYSLTNRDQRELGTAQSPGWLGFTEGMIILGSVDLLFAAFVGVQVRYFFGGEANITLEGFTYSEYARRGFGELVAVAFFSLLLLLGLSAITRREAPRQRRIYSGAGVIQVLLVSVILVSAFQRLVLYEQAYGFTRLRTYTHVFMLWLAVLLLGVVFLELADRLRRFAFIAVLSALGFGISLNLLNVDQFIVQQNVARTRFGYELDSSYLATLTLDSIPAVVKAFQNPALPVDVHNGLGGILACQAVVSVNNKSITWQAFHFSKDRASQLIQSLQDELQQDYPVVKDDNGPWLVKIRGVARECFTIRWD